MSRQHRIFSERTPSTPFQHSRTDPPSKLDPFHSNYTVTGLIQHIQTTLADLIQRKQLTRQQPEPSHSQQIGQLLKIQDEVSVLKNIIIYNLDQILGSIYPQPSKSKEDPKTNHTASQETLNQEDHLDRSLPITDFQPDCHPPVHHLLPQPHHLSHPHSPTQSHHPSRSSEAVPSQPQPPQKPIQTELEQRQITPFELCDQSSFGKMRIEDNQDESLDLICYEDEEIISRNAKEQKMKGFSPIPEREAEEEQTVQKRKIDTVPKGQGPEQPTTPSFNSSLKKRLFSYTGAGVLPRRVSHKKYNYLQQIQERQGW